MECQVCLEQFNVVERRPKFLPCGHSYCLRCLQQLPVKVCPLDKKEFLIAPEALVDNFSLLDAPSRPLRFWCITCKKEASDACVEEHAVRSLRKERAKEAEQHLQSLQRGAAGLLMVEIALASVDEYVEQCLGQMRRELTSLLAAQTRVQDAVEADSAVWERAKEDAVLVLRGLTGTAALLEPDLLDPAVECSVTVRRGNDEAWKGVVEPAEDAVARLLLCRLALSGKLQQSVPQDVPHWEEISNTANMSGADIDIKALVVVGKKVARVRRPGRSYKDSEAGTVTRLEDDGTVMVRWDRTGLINTYSMKPGSYNLRPLPPQLQADVGAASRTLSVDSISACADMKPKGKLLADTRFSEVRTLTGLHCAPAAQWSQIVLEQVAPHLEGLQLVNPDQQHIDLVVTMPRLQRLAITGVTGNTLQKVVQMASLRSLELHCPLEVPLPALDLTGIAAGLQWLRCGVHPLAAALALARQHAGSLEELQLVAASTQPYGCTDLAQRLQRCGFSKLRRVVLLRHDAYDNFCRHDEKSCKKQVLHISFFLSESGLSVDVLCTTCNPECLTTK